MTRSRTAGMIAAGVITAVIGLSLAGQGVALAGAFTVTDCSGSVSDTGSLPYAVANASAGDTITFEAGLSCPAASPITLTSTLDITQNLTITGPGAAALAVSGGGTVGVVDISGAAVVGISGLTIENGSSTSLGGGISNNGGSATLDDSTVSDNSTTSEGGGGGISNLGGSMTITDSTISDNTTSLSGGGMYAFAGSVTVTGSTISGNSATGDGGGIGSDGAVNAGATIVAGNTSGAGNDPNCSGGITSAGYNLTDDTTGGPCGFTRRPTWSTPIPCSARWPATAVPPRPCCRGRAARRSG